MTNEEAITYANCLKNNYTINFDDMADFCDMAIKVLVQEPKTGHWQKISADKYSEHVAYYFRCSECGKDIIGEHNYCPNCGSRMGRSE